jgi:hypothetical protein
MKVIWLTTNFKFFFGFLKIFWYFFLDFLFFVRLIVHFNVQRYLRYLITRMNFHKLERSWAESVNLDWMRWIEGWGMTGSCRHSVTPHPGGRCCSLLYSLKKSFYQEFKPLIWTLNSIKGKNFWKLFLNFIRRINWKFLTQSLKNCLEIFNVLFYSVRE